VHAFQTAERIRAAYPGEGMYVCMKELASHDLLTALLEYDWFHLIGLIHDCGKVLALWGEPQVCYL